MFKTFDEFIKESYNNLGFIKSRSNYYLINESQESTSQHEAIKLVMNRFGWDRERANKFVRVELRNDITPLRDKQIGKFTLGVTRMYCDGELNDASTISNLNATLKLLTAHLGEYDRNLNGLHVDDLISKFEKNRENNIKKEKQEISKMKFGESDYEIVKIDSFNDAQKYYKYTNPDSRWCLTHMEDMYDSYTCGGINQIYFCLKNGFEDIDIDEIEEENTPLDEYGLSMLSIIVNENGELAFCTTRWNHDNGGDDNAMNAVEISKVVNVNFYETFKPNTKWKDLIDNAKQRLANGDDINEIFDNVDVFNDDYAMVNLNNRYNFINKNRELISDRWYDEVGKFNDGYMVVKSNDKYNLINKNLELLSDRWYNFVSDFKDGYARVVLNNKYNLINNIDGKYVLKEWYDCIYDYKNGYARVRLNKKYNFINRKGKLVLNDWCDSVENFEDGHAKIFISGKGLNFINENGEFLLDDWYDEIREIRYNDYVYAKVKLNGKCNFINKEMKFVSDDWYDSILNFENGYAKVKLNDKYNFINKELKLVFDEWYDEIIDVYHNDYVYAKVKLNDKYNYINKEMKLVLDDWYDKIEENYYNDYVYAKVKLNGKYNFINKEMKFVSDDWYDEVGDFHDGYAKVKLNGKYNFINKKIKLVSDDWYDNARDFREGYAEVKLNDKYNLINKEIKLVFDEWYDNIDNFKNPYISYTRVKLNGKYNLINRKRKLICDDWYDFIYDFKGDYALVELNDMYNFINEEGKIMRDKWFYSIHDADYFREKIG